MAEQQENNNLEGKYLSFHIGAEEYGISILKIREIIGMMAITAMPQSPDYVKGVINLRGKVIPILDLRRRFGMAAAKQTEQTCIIVLETGLAPHRMILTGIVVDSVSEVQYIKAADIEAPAAFSAELDGSYILGMAKSSGAVKIILDIEAVLGTDKIAMREEINLPS
ncbi:MAG: chemotaxis protein CheW [Deltaproteobacteria bacterium RIFOXYD12_FULL_56_24]|nr:MAG: chemotaxis protein CheW [Deltaproteobacteria bacterium RIFOXYD12_FULL_56_24]